MTLVSNARVFPSPAAIRCIRKRAGYSETGTTHPRECPGKDIWVWTGYKLDELNATQMQVVDLINVLVDGKFVQDLKDPSLIWRGSSNQVVHHLR
ncbi:anaerobic ribonucleoside-triphosphate reductase activating protein [Escherichia coli]|uniref:Anaerobic ribonucleoside-triphosphate reductase activating protein n=1 Tax=Escherichia coli TaxID=562 RepID=A0A376TP81_ECOLX|nr:anaerobic ribonucleoside-triphosphate reductase activating protein [Escherichia coli]